MGCHTPHQLGRDDGRDDKGLFRHRLPVPMSRQDVIGQQQADLVATQDRIGAVMCPDTKTGAIAIRICGDDQGGISADSSTLISFPFFVKFHNSP